MSVRARDVANRVVMVSALVGLAVAFLSAPASAAVGDVLRRVLIPVGDPATCTDMFFAPPLEANSPIGTSVAVVQGSKVGHPEYPILLVVSCASTTLSKAATLYFLDPATGATVKQIITKDSVGITFAPPAGWGALVYRPDRADLLGCGNDSTETQRHAIYKINISAGMDEGKTQFLFNGQSGNMICDGLTWDPSDKTIYQGQDVSTSIAHYSESGVPLNTLPVPTACGGKSGLAVVGGALFVACDGNEIVFQLSKTTPYGEIRHFTTPTNTRTEDLECDPVTFASQGVDAIWSKDAYPADPTTNLPSATGRMQLFAFAVPAGTCSLPTGPTVLYPAACLKTVSASNKTFVLDATGKPIQDPTNTADADGDGLLDCWEDGSIWAANAPCPGCPKDGLPGIDFDGDGIRDIILCVDANGNGVFEPALGECTNPNVKDLFVELDAMVGRLANVIALNQVVTAFANARVDNPVPGGSGLKGIRLHIQIDDQNIPFTPNTALTPCTPTADLTVTPVIHPVPDADFDTLKVNWFGTAAERTLRSGNTGPLSAPGTFYDSNQRAKTLLAKKFAFRYGISVGNLTRPAGTSSASGCAEIGGNDFVVALGSFIGTTDEWAGTFMHEFGHTLGLRHGGGDNINCKPNYLSVMSYSRQFSNVITDRPLNYSYLELPAHLVPLNEAALVEANGIGGVAAPAGSKTTYAASTATSTGTAIIASATGAISWNGNKSTSETVAVDINKIGSGTGCDGAGTVLYGFNDWENLQYNLRASLDFADGVHSTADEAVEITPEQAQAQYAAADADADGVPDANACGPAPLGGPCKIDIAPGVSSNTVPLFNNNGVPTAVVPVAILSTVLFDATTVNPTTAKLNATPVAFNPGGKAICSVRDVNGDNLRDLVCTFVLTGISPGDEIGVLEATTYTGKAIRAQDKMHVVPVQ